MEFKFQIQAQRIHPLLSPSNSRRGKEAISGKKTGLNSHLGYQTKKWVKFLRSSSSSLKIRTEWLTKRVKPKPQFNLTREGISEPQSTRTNPLSRAGTSTSEWKKNSRTSKSKSQSDTKKVSY